MNAHADHYAYYSSAECTPQFTRFWDQSYDQTQLLLAATTGLLRLIEEQPSEWDTDDLEGVERYLEEGAVARMVDSFQTYVTELISAIFSKIPEMAPNLKVDSRFVFRTDSLEELKVALVEQLATKYAYMNIVDLDDELRRQYSFELFPNSMRRLRVKRLVEIRNVIVHNRGFVNRTFLQRAGAKADRLGDRVRLPAPDAADEYLLNAAEAIDREAVRKFQLRRETDD